MRCHHELWNKDARAVSVHVRQRSGDGLHARFAPVGRRLLLWWIWIWMPSPYIGGLLSRLALLFCSPSLFRVFWLCRLCPLVLCLWSHACSALLLRLLMEACHPGAPGAESQCLIVRCIYSLHCFWLTAHFLPFALSGSCSCPPNVSRR